ncbi:YqhG family protein [Oceanobacillus alkalisoli]|uniref:YqhG family protein n=1 Tax=Oceanobacillus alkalisoli TaxID=2925113 RepID=UPI001F12039F|nr:YqhG family protein [Oceanobacillus alkalisoli]MCF3941757.1 YqhG family protein [Oceanobacillus alkalisoli]
MAIVDIEQFIIDYFSAYQCNPLKMEDGVMQVELTEELDKILMNRPFYWHYIQSLGQEGVPMTLTLITNPDKREQAGEWIDIGSPRLQQIFNHVTQHEKYTLLFQEVNTDKNTPLYPWLLANFKVSYRGRQKKEEIISLGIQLVTGKVIVNMMDELNKLALKQQISNFCYTISPIITLTSGFKRIEKIIQHYVENQPKEWANEALETRNEEIALLKQFYKDDLENNIVKKEMEEINNRYTPEITIDVTSGGLIYLLQDFPDIERFS